MIIKQLLAFVPPGEEASPYETYQIYHFDISYHLANFYKLLNDIYAPGSTDTWGIFLMMFGMAKYQMFLIDDGYGGYYQTYRTVDTHYYLPMISGILLLIIGILLLIAGTYYLTRRDIS